MKSPIEVLVPLATGCEELEAITIVDLLRRADIKVITASLDKQPVKCARNTVIVADTTIDSISDKLFDCIVLPGGLPGADNLNEDVRIHQLISKHAEQDKYIGAICAAPKVLLSNGVLNGKKATAFPGSLSQLDTSLLRLSDAPTEVDGKIITSRGPGTAMDFALLLIEKLLGKEQRDSVESALQRS